MLTGEAYFDTAGYRLRFVRKRLRLTRQELAKIIGVHPVAIAEWEINRFKIMRRVARRIQDLLVISADWLLFGNKDLAPPCFWAKAQPAYVKNPEKAVIANEFHLPKKCKNCALGVKYREKLESPGSRGNGSTAGRRANKNMRKPVLE